MPLISIGIAVYFSETVTSTLKLKGDLIHSATVSSVEINAS
jgi:hypothetical protein